MRTRTGDHTAPSRYPAWVDSDNAMDAIVGEGLLRLEDLFNDQGWDNVQDMPHVGFIYFEAPDCIAFGCTDIPVARDLAHGVYQFGHIMAEHPSDRTAAVAEQYLDRTGFYGTYLIGQGHAEFPDFDHAPTRVRTIMAVDIDGIAYRLDRLADHEPVLVSSVVGAEVTHPTDTNSALAIEGLRLITLAITRYLPDNTRYVDALMNLDLHLNIKPSCGNDLHSSGN